MQVICQIMLKLTSGRIYYPFLDHCIADFSQRFPDSAQSMFLGHKLMHGKVSDITNQEIESIKSFYGYDLPNVGCFESEIEIWKAKCSQEELAPSTLLDTLKLADCNFFPNVHAIIKLILTLPVGSVPCERSFSTMRRLKSWTRSTMTEEDCVV